MNCIIIPNNLKDFGCPSNEMSKEVYYSKFLRVAKQITTEGEEKVKDAVLVNYITIIRGTYSNNILVFKDKKFGLKLFSPPRKFFTQVGVVDDFSMLSASTCLEVLFGSMSGKEFMNFIQHTAIGETYITRDDDIFTVSTEVIVDDYYPIKYPSGVSMIEIEKAFQEVLKEENTVTSWERKMNFKVYNSFRKVGKKK